MDPLTTYVVVKASRPVLRLTLAVVAGAAVLALVAVVGLAGAQITSATKGAESAAGASCTGGQAPGQVQLTNAAAIVAQGRQMGVGDAGLVVALTTALVESTLHNWASAAVPESAQFPNDGVVPGNYDSVGLFQQRGAGWGTLQERMTPSSAAQHFFDALNRVSGWQQMPPGDAAQAVQRSARPDAYATRVDEARTILAQTDGLVTCQMQAAQVRAVTGGGGGFTDGVGGPIPRANPRTVDQAIAWARAEAASGAGGWYRRCLAFVAQTYGWSFSGVNYAIDHYTTVPPEFRHPAGGPDGRTPQPGALMYWDTGSRAGHIALYLGGGQIASNDIITNGQISVVAASDIETKWGATFVGWTAPYFPRAG